MSTGSGRDDNEVVHRATFALSATNPHPGQFGALMCGLRAGLRPHDSVSGRALARTSHCFAM
jgi:hypothetical protein